jgi:DNA-binding transcriptional LysR family regulator
MNLRRLRYFVVVAEELNFSRAAERLRMSQPPLSAQIKQLEGELGVKLFDRVRLGVRLTEAGRLLLDKARHIFLEIDRAVDEVRQVSEGRIGRLAIGFLPSAAHSVLPSVLREFRERFPDVELFLQEMGPDEAVQRLHDKRIDASFLYLPVNEVTLDVKVVHRDPLIVALPETHPLATETQVAMHQLAEEPFILPPQHQLPACYGQIIQTCRRAGFLPKAVQKDVSLMQTIVGLVAGGLGVALVPASLQNLRSTSVAYKGIRDLAPALEMGVVWRHDDVSTVLGAFLGVVDDIFSGKHSAAEMTGQTIVADRS